MFTYIKNLFTSKTDSSLDKQIKKLQEKRTKLLEEQLKLTALRGVK
jgi:uncharacterized membrane protein (DUF106 family)